MSKDKIKAGVAPRGYDIMEEAAVIDAVTRDGAAFLKPGLNDIGVVLYAASLIEKVLRMSIISGFRADAVSKTMIANVFDGKGPLATFSAKIELCAGLGIILGDVRHDLKIINAIRNDFAHSSTELFLKDYAVCRSLRVTSNVLIQDDECPERHLFKRSCAGIIARVCFGTLVRVAQHRFLTANREGVDQEYEAMMRSLNEDSSTPIE